MKVLITDMRHSSSLEEEKVLFPAGLELDKTFCESEEDLIRNGEGAIGFLVSYARITRRVMEALPDLRVIVKYGIGVDTIDLAAATDTGKYVVNIPDYCIEEVALQALALASAGLRMSPHFNAIVRSGGWVSDPEPFIQYRPSQIHLGLAGFGRIARKLGSYMENIVGGIRYFDPFLPPGGATLPACYQREADLGSLFEKCALVSLHIPMNEQTRGSVGAGVFSRGKNIVLVNTSRGGIVDKMALLSALDSGNIGFYGTDVMWEEPPDRSDPLNRAILEHPKVYVTPHVAWCSQESARQVRRSAAEEVVRVFRGGLPLNVVNRDVLGKTAARFE